MNDRKRPPVAIWIAPIIIAILGFSRVSQSPQFETYRTVDVVQLVGSGVGLGAALVGIVMSLKRRPA